MKNGSQYLSRFAELYERQGRQVAKMDNKFWVNYGKIIVPIGPINGDYAISEEQARRLMKMIPGALMVRYTYGYHEPDSCKDWYAVICDEFKDLSMFRSNYRREIKKGLENCEVRQVDAHFIAEYGYEVYISAFSRYKGGAKPLDKYAFNQLISATKIFDDIYHYWAVFYNNKLIAYSMVAIYGNDEAEFSVSKFIPDYLKYYSHNSLIYTLTEHYLSKLSMQYFNTGFRSIYHKTDVQSFYIKKFLFNKKFLNMSVTYNYLLLYFINSTFPIRKLLSKANDELRAIYLLEEINRNCNAKKSIHESNNDKVKENLHCAS
ncbi:MAG: hypothetical protein WAL29_16380 [Bacteroidales bacterium]